MPQNIAEFRIIGRVAKVTQREKVTFVRIAANYNHPDGDDWRTETLWNNVVCFGELAHRVAAADNGDLVHVTGRVRENAHGEGNDRVYKTELIADTFSILAKADKDRHDGGHHE